MRVEAAVHRGDAFVDALLAGELHGHGTPWREGAQARQQHERGVARAGERRADRHHAGDPAFRVQLHHHELADQPAFAVGNDHRVGQVTIPDVAGDQIRGLGHREPVPVQQRQHMHRMAGLMQPPDQRQHEAPILVDSGNHDDGPAGAAEEILRPGPRSGAEDLPPRRVEVVLDPPAGSLQHPAHAGFSRKVSLAVAWVLGEAQDRFGHFSGTVVLHAHGRCPGFRASRARAARAANRRHQSADATGSLAPRSTRTGAATPKRSAPRWGSPS